MPSDPFQTVKEVADLLKVSEVKVRGWIKDGDLRAIHIGKGWRISVQDLDAFLARHATRPARNDNDARETKPDAQGLQGSKEPGN